MSLKGIDISNWQSSINLHNIDADFVIIKATEGVGWTDPSFKKLYAMAKAAGKKLGIYHFARPTSNNTAQREAQTFLNAANSVGAVKEAILVLDWEAENKTNVAYAKAWLDAVYAATGVKPMIYMSESVTKQANWSSVVAGDYGLWVAKYRDNNIDYNYDMSNAGTKPNVKYWPGYAIWQWTSSGRLNGYSANLDCNIFYGDGAAWDAYAGAAGGSVQPSDPLAQYTNEQLAQMVIDGKFGAGDERKAALGNRYAAVQAIVNQMLADKDLISTKYVKNYTTTFKGSTVHIGRISKEADMRASLIGNAPGTANDKLSSQYFSDKLLLNKGYKEATAQNASTFYYWNGACFAEGLEIVQGVNHQDFNMSAVSSFNTAMAAGFPYDGGIVFAPQSYIINHYKEYYGAVTSGFGIIYNGQKNSMGSNLPRNGIYNAISGRSILAEDDKYWYSICVYGVTGSSGLRGYDLYDLCIQISPTMKNAMCFDGGGSVFQRVNGSFNLNTTRLVKNAVLMYIKNDAEIKPEPQPTPIEKKLEVGAKVQFKKGAWNLDTGLDFTDLGETIVSNIKNKRIETEKGPVAVDFIELL